VGSFLVAALFATCWWFSGNVAYVPPLKGPLSESIHIRIHSDAIEDCLEPACLVDQNMESDVSPKRQASARRSRRTRAAKAFTAPNPFHTLPGKS
jgi:hypothetical protein